MKPNSFIGSRSFYRTLLAVAIPILIQNGITNFISLLDNIMVGRIGTEQMSGVSIVNQLIFVFNLCIFGAISGAGLFGAQFFGKGDHAGVRYTFRFKLFASLGLFAAALALLLLAGEPLIALYLHEGSETGDLALTMHYAKEYLAVSLFGLLPYTVTQVYASSLREVGENLPPMSAGILGVAINLSLNYVLIFGKLGAPALGVTGAAIATVVSRVAECITVILWTHIHASRCRFIKGAYRSLYVPVGVLGSITKTGTPLLINETLWAAGQAMLLQCYSFRGIASVSAMNISNTLQNTFSVLYLSIGSAISILIGHLLGAGKQAEARADARRLITFAAFMGLCASALLLSFSGFFPDMYETTEEVKSIARGLTMVNVLAAPIGAILNSSYFTLRSGGKTVITFLFDSGYVWCVNIPLVLALTRLTSLPTITVYLICQGTELFKCILGLILVNKGIWLNNITVETSSPEPASKEYPL